MGAQVGEQRMADGAGEAGGEPRLVEDATCGAEGAG